MSVGFGGEVRVWSSLAGGVWVADEGIGDAVGGGKGGML